MSISILIVEDSLRKIERLRELVGRIVPETAVALDVASDAATSVVRLSERRYDLLILDVDLPLRAGEPARAEGGLEVLRAINSRRPILRPIHIVGLSGYPDLVERYRSEFSGEMWHLITYRDDSDEWAQQLGRKLIHVADSVVAPPFGTFDTDLAIVTALHKVELEAVLDLCDSWQVVRPPDDSTAYHVGAFQRGSTSLSVVAAASAQMGMPAATALAMKIMSRFRPRYLAMVGIAAGVKGNFGDILVVDESWDYGSGKAKAGDEGRSAFLPGPSSIPLSPHLKSRFEVFGLDRSVLTRIQLCWQGNESLGAPLQAHIGPVASGAAVLAHRPLIEELVARNRNLIGIEMETYGVFLAGQQCVAPRPQVMSVKSICDFADERKNDEYQRYAAFTSARYLYEFALAELADAIRQSQVMSSATS